MATTKTTSDQLADVLWSMGPSVVEDSPMEIYLAIRRVFPESAHVFWLEVDDIRQVYDKYTLDQLDDPEFDVKR